MQPDSEAGAREPRNPRVPPRAITMTSGRSASVATVDDLVIRPKILSSLNRNVHVDFGAWVFWPALTAESPPLLDFIGRQVAALGVGDGRECSVQAAS